jgi:hypothetical protein
MVDAQDGSAGSLVRCRGRALSATIVILAVAIVAASLAIVSSQALHGLLPDWFDWYIAMLSAVRLVALLMTWLMRRFGVYLFCASELVEVSVGWAVTPFLGVVAHIAVVVATLLLLAAAWFALLRPKWSEFS